MSEINRILILLLTLSILAVTLTPNIIILAFFATLLAIESFFSKRKKRSFNIVIILVTLIFLINYNQNISKEKISPGKKYSFTATGDNFLKVSKVNGKTANKNFILKLDDSSIRDFSSYTVEGEVNTIKREEHTVFLSISPTSVTKIEENSYKRFLNKRLENLLHSFPSDFSDFILAVLLGEKEGISKERREIFSYTGTSHIIVISGFHIGIIILLFIGLQDLLKVPYKIKYAITIVFLTFYCYAVGFSPSVLRAYIMGVIFLFSKLFNEEYELKKAFLVSLAISLIINPYSLIDISFQMSYLAVYGIIFIYPRLRGYLDKYDNRIFRYFIFSFSIQIALTPVFIYYFRFIPILSFVTNLVVLPLAMLFISLAFGALFLSFIGVGKFAMPLVFISYNIVVLLIEQLYKLPLLQYKIYTKLPLSLFSLLIVAVIFLRVDHKIEKKHILLFVLFGILIYRIDVPLEIKRYQIRNNLYFKKNIKVLILNEELRENDIVSLKTNGIKEIDLILSTKPVKEEIMELFKVARFKQINKNERIKIRDSVIENNKGVLTLLDEETSLEYIDF